MTRFVEPGSLVDVDRAQDGRQVTVADGDRVGVPATPAGEIEHAAGIGRDDVDRVGSPAPLFRVVRVGGKSALASVPSTVNVLPPDAAVRRSGC